MTTPNSVYPTGNGTPAGSTTLTSPPAISPMDALAASYDVRDDVPDIVIPPQAPPQAPSKPVAPAATPPAATTGATETPAPSSLQQPIPLKHPTWLAKQALEVCGLHPLVLEHLDTPSLTQIVMEQMHQRLANAADVSRAAAVTNPAPAGLTDPRTAAAAIAPAAAVPGVVPGVATPPPGTTEPAWDWGEHQAFDEYGNVVAGKKMKYTDDMINPALAHHIKAMAKELAELKAWKGSLQEKVVNNQRAQFDREFDAAFNLYPEVFGSGDIEQIKGSPEHLQRRQLVFGAVRGMFRGLDPQIASKMTIADGVKAMTKSIFGKDAPAPAGQGAPEDHPGAHFAGADVAVPTNRQGNPKPLGESRARDAVKKWWDDHKDEGTPSDATTTMDEFF